MKRKLLEEAAQELNIFMDLDPKINIKSQAKELKQKVHEAGCLLEEGEQELSISTGQRSGESDNDFEARKVRVQRVQETLKELGVPLFADTKQGTEEKQAETDSGEMTEKETEIVPKEEKAVAESEKVTEKEETIVGPKHTSLTEMVQETTKLADLKAIVETEEEFASLRESLDDYTGLQGPRMLKAEMLKALGVDSTPKVKKEKKAKKNGPGVIKTIKEVLKSKGPISKADILLELKKAFPERNPDSMKRTINVQVPSRINKESTFQVKRNEEAKYYVVE